jgi:hypothetical protein
MNVSEERIDSIFRVEIDIFTLVEGREELKSHA